MRAPQPAPGDQPHVQQEEAQHALKRRDDKAFDPRHPIGASHHSDDERPHKQHDRPVQQDFAPQARVHPGARPRPRRQPQGRHDRRSLHRRGDGHHVAFAGYPGSGQHGCRRHEGHDRDRAIMCRHGRAIQRRKPRQRAKQREGDERQRERQRDPARQRRQQIGPCAVFGHCDPALEADGKQQIQRHRLGRSLWHRQFRPRQRRCQTKAKAQDHRRQKICAGQGQNALQVYLPPVCSDVRPGRSRGGDRTAAGRPRRYRSTARAASDGRPPPPRR